MCRLLAGSLVAVILSAGLSRARADESATPELGVWAASSLRDVLGDLAPRAEAALRIRLVFNFGASSDLARQIMAAPKADVFFPADEDWMDRVDAAGLVDRASRRSLLGNELVVVVPVDSHLRVTTASDLASPAVRRLSLANPEAVPAGKYAKEWLERAGAWESVRERVIPGIDVRAALAAVESGAIDAGIVYRTDAAISRRVRVAFAVPSGQGPRIRYPAAAVAGGPFLDAARRLVDWLDGPEAETIFEQHGFLVQRAETP